MTVTLRKKMQMNYDLGISYFFLSQITHASCVGGTSLLYESNNVIYISVWDVHLIFFSQQLTNLDTKAWQAKSQFSPCLLQMAGTGVGLHLYVFPSQ